MIINIFLLAILMMTMAMAAAKRITALIRGFFLQSLLLFLLTAALAIKGKNAELYIIALLLLLVKVVLIPYFLKRTVQRIRMEENLGLLVNPLLSLCISLFLAYLAYLFVGKVMSVHSRMQGTAFAISLTVILIGLFIMTSRMKALSQIIGLLVMENGLFLAAGVITGGMPFFVEIAIFCDIFVCVIILGAFVYKINKLFTHIDVNKLTELKG